MDKKLYIRNFLGINKKADPSDIDQHQCQTLDGFDVYKRPGSLVKRSGYTDEAGTNLPASYPSSWTIKNFFRFNVTQPSETTITVVHATVGGADRVYVDKTYDGAWVTGWVELTEQEEELSGTTSVLGTRLTSSSLASSQDDYYKGWYVFKWDSTTPQGSLVTSYNGAQKKLYLQESIGNDLTIGSFSIYRFPMMVQYEGVYTMYTDSSTTEAMDVETFDTESTAVHYQLRQDFEDAYNGWTLWNTGQGASGTISDYQPGFAGNNRKLITSSVTGQGDGDTYYVYDTTRTIEVDDKIEFHQRPNVLIMATGNTYRYPKQFPFWYGYIRKTYFFGDKDNSIDEGYYMEPATLDAPDDDIIGTVSTTAGVGPSSGNYYFACAYVYDGYQLGPLTSASKAQSMMLTTTSDEAIAVTLKIGYPVPPNMKHSKTMNRRVTAVQVFVSDDFEIEKGSGAWYRLAQIPIRQDFDIGYGNTKTIVPSEVNDKNPRTKAYLDESGRTSESINLSSMKFDWVQGLDDLYWSTIILDSTLWDNKGFYYSQASGGILGNRISYETATETMNHSIVGKIFSENSDSSVIAYSPLKPDGTPSPDYLPVLNTLDMAQYGITSITTIKACRDYIYVVGASKTVRMSISPGIVPAFRVDAEFPYVGTDAPNGVMRYGDGIIVSAKRGIYYLDASEHLLSASIEDIDNLPIGVTTDSEGYMAFNGETNEIVLVYPTDEKMYCYNIISKQWAIHSTATGLKAICTGKDGELYGADDDYIYRLNYGTTDGAGSGYIDPDWKSKVYNFGSPDMLKTIKRFAITYKSDTEFTFNVYKNRSDTAETWNNTGDNVLPASTSITTVMLDAPSKFRGYTFEFQFCFEDRGASAIPGRDSFVYIPEQYNTYLWIDEIVIEYAEEER